jgi:hypothetical protein
MSSTLARNLAALAARDAALAGRLASSPASAALEMSAARSGALVPGLREEGRLYNLHSLVDPAREAERLRAAQGSPGFAVFLGIAGGYQLSPFLSDPSLSGALAVEYGAPILRAILESMDLTTLFRDERLTVLLDPSPGQIERALLSAYLPAVMGGLHTVVWRARWERDAPLFSRAAREVEAAARAFRADYAAQARFGRRWAVNILLNLPRAETASLTVPRSASATIAGAGPSLEDHAARPGEQERGGMLIAVDTALPVLAAMGIIPSLSVSIDCQQYGYLHYMPPFTDACPRLIDLASPPVLGRGASRLGFFAGGHPLCGYLRERWRRFPCLDTSGGNVSHTAVSLAVSLGARHLRLWGLDFGYPRGKPYARGTYLASYFASRAGRLAPEESRYHALAFGRGPLERTQGAGGWIYTTPLMRGYRESLERLLAASGVEIVQRGEPRPTGEPPGSPSGTWGDPGPAAASWRIFLKEYAGRLGELGALSGQPAAAFRRLPAEERMVWATVVPLVAGMEAGSMSAHGPVPAPRLDRAVLLEEARRWMARRVTLALGAPD